MIVKKFTLLFLGYGKKKTKLINFLQKKGIKVKHLSRKLKVNDLKGIDLIISFGYNQILDKKILKNLKRPALNLHISYLPHNRGSDPNFWSFINNTPKGISIHEIDQGLDTGDIILRKKISMNPQKKKFSTFKKTYIYLIKEIEKLFISNFNLIINYQYSSFKQRGKKSFHKKSEIPKLLKDWDMNILDFKKLYFKNLSKK